MGNEDLVVNSGAAGMGIGMVIVWLLFAILMIASQWKLNTKAGEPGWACIVPFYNIIVMLKIAGKPLWWIALMFIPLVNVVVSIMMLSGFVKAFGKNGVGSVLLALFFGIIYFPYLAFSKEVIFVGNSNPFQNSRY